MRKSQTTIIIIFLLLLFYLEKFIFCYKRYLEKHVCIVTFVLQVFFVADYCKCSNKTPRPIQIRTGLEDTLRRLRILGNRLGVLKQILIAMDYYLFLYISGKYLQFRKEQKHSLRKIFGYSHTSNPIYLLRNCF